MIIPNIAIVGATGLIGERLLEIFDERGTDIGELRLFGRTANDRTLSFRGWDISIEALDGASFGDSDFVFFSAGAKASKQHARRLAAQGAVVIDNSNAHRMETDVPLVVPQVNADRLKAFAGDALVANPNCSTIPIARALHALADLEPRSVVVSTYQAVSGAGHAGLSELDSHARSFTSANADAPLFGRPIAGNLMPSIDAMLESGETVEERKMRDENRKILGLPSLSVSTTCVRVPVRNCHAAAVCIDFARSIEIDEVLQRLTAADEFEVHADFPTPLEVDGSNEVHVGRVRIDLEHPDRLLFWIVSDNTRVGAALNAVQIMERILPMMPARRRERTTA